MGEPAKVLEDRPRPGDWCVEWFDDEGGREVAIFAAPRAEQRARAFAAAFYSSPA